MNRAGIDLLKHYEGFSPTAYLDMVGVPTIGFGFTEGVNLGDRMTMAEAEARLQKELAHYESAVLDACTVVPNDNQFAAMTSLCFNIGVAGFQGSTVLRRHNEGDWAGAANAFGMWNKAGNRVVPGLVKRRAAERELYLT